MNHPARNMRFSVSSEEEKRQVLAQITQLDCWCSIRNDGAWHFEVHEADFHRLFPRGVPGGGEGEHLGPPGPWIVQAEQIDGMSYLFISRVDRPGELHLKADAEGYVADLYAKQPHDPVATAAAPYEELVTAEETDERRFGDLRIGAQFFDAKSGELFEKVGDQEGKCLFGGDAFEGKFDHFSVDERVLYRVEAEAVVREHAYRWPHHRG